MRYIIPVVVIAVAVTVAFALITIQAHADIGDQLAKLLPEDTADGDRFGFSVSISGTTTIVGAFED